MPKIEVGKWKMRNGGPAVVIADSNPLDAGHPYPVIGWTRIGLTNWKRDGRYKGDCDSEYDLMEPWVDPPTPLEALKKWRGKYSGPAEKYVRDWQDLIRAIDALIAAEEAKVGQ